MELQWNEGFEISVGIDGDTVTVSANREGLLSLARHLAALADMAAGNHIHLDAHNSLEDGSAELIVERIDRFAAAGPFTADKRIAAPASDSKKEWRSRS